MPIRRSLRRSFSYAPSSASLERALRPRAAEASTLETERKHLVARYWDPAARTTPAAACSVEGSTAARTEARSSAEEARRSEPAEGSNLAARCSHSVVLLVGTLDPTVEADRSVAVELAALKAAVQRDSPVPGSVRLRAVPEFSREEILVPLFL